MNDILNAKKIYKIWRQSVLPRLMIGQFIILSLALVLDAPVYAATIRSVSTGDTSACAVVDSTVKCWGLQTYGRLGNGKTTGVQSTPTAVGGLLAGKRVTKVSVGATHACALMNAKVYCWGDGRHGELGNRASVTSSTPVAVDTQPTDNTSVRPTKPKSALGNKEVIDIAAGEYFTCALVSDGSVSCWGMGDNGRLGTGSNTDVNYPKPVIGAIVGKKGIKLAKVAGATMCALAIDSSESSTSTTGHPYCWGYGMGPGGITDKKVQKCNMFSTMVQTTTYSTVYFESNVSVSSAGVASMLNNIDIASSNDVTGISGGKAYYWGLHGQKTTVIHGGQTGTGCNVQVCRMVVAPEIRSTARLASYHPSSSGVNATLVNRVQGGNGNAGQHNPSGANSSAPGVNPDKKKKVCTNQPHYDTTTIRQEIGSVTTLGPLYTSAGPLTSGITNASGNAYTGLFCGQTGANVIYCDAHSTDETKGQLGLTLAQVQACAPSRPGGSSNCGWGSVSGPQPVYASGWLNGKTVTDLDTGDSGFTCATVSGGIGCWGVNTSGQLGNGNTTNQFNATAVVGL